MNKRYDIAFLVVFIGYVISYFLPMDRGELVYAIFIEFFFRFIEGGVKDEFIIIFIGLIFPVFSFPLLLAAFQIEKIRTKITLGVLMLFFILPLIGLLLFIFNYIMNNPDYPETFGGLFLWVFTSMTMYVLCVLKMRADVVIEGNKDLHQHLIEDE